MRRLAAPCCGGPAQGTGSNGGAQATPTCCPARLRPGRRAQPLGEPRASMRLIRPGWHLIRRGRLRAGADQPAVPHGGRGRRGRGRAPARLHPLALHPQRAARGGRRGQHGARRCGPALVGHTKDRRMGVRTYCRTIRAEPDCTGARRKCASGACADVLAPCGSTLRRVLDSCGAERNPWSCLTGRADLDMHPRAHLDTDPCQDLPIPLARAHTWTMAPA
jgi:hypothetical protein